MDLIVPPGQQCHVQEQLRPLDWLGLRRPAGLGCSWMLLAHEASLPACRTPDEIPLRSRRSCKNDNATKNKSVKLVPDLSDYESYLGYFPPVKTIKKVVGAPLIGVGLQCGLHARCPSYPNPFLFVVPPVPVKAGEWRRRKIYHLVAKWWPSLKFNSNSSHINQSFTHFQLVFIPGRKRDSECM